MSVTPDEKFQAFVDANPWVVTRLAELGIALRRRGHTRLSINMLFETLRYQVLETTDPNSSFKLNNDYRSRMARLLMQRYPTLDGTFEIRRLRGEGGTA